MTLWLWFFRSWTKLTIMCMNAVCPTSPSSFHVKPNQLNFSKVDIPTWFSVCQNILNCSHYVTFITWDLYGFSGVSITHYCGRGSNTTLGEITWRDPQWSLSDPQSLYIVLSMKSEWLERHYRNKNKPRTGLENVGSKAWLLCKENCRYRAKSHSYIYTRCR